MIFDCVVDKAENCFPMIPSGKAHNEMILNDYLGERRHRHRHRREGQDAGVNAMPTLVIANKCYSSWSLRPWLLMKELGIAFDEVPIPLDHPDTKARILEHSPAGKVPILIDGDVTVWESLAIMEYVAERSADAGLAAGSQGARALARSIAAEMHSGFPALRSACPMNLGKKIRGRAIAARRWRADVARFTAIVARGARSASARRRSGRSCSAPSRRRMRCTRPW